MTVGKLQKAHTKPQAGRKAEKKKVADFKKRGVIKQKQKNPKAFGVNSYRKALRLKQRKADKDQKKLHEVKANRTTEECVDPPVFVAVIGPKGSGKTTLIKSMVKHYTKHNISEVKGPVTCVTGKKRRVTFFEVPTDLNSMIDAAKVCDLALLLVDASFGFEMEIFEFLNIAQLHGFPRVMGVLTHLDTFKSVKTLKRVKKEMKHRFWEEIYQGAKLFYFSGIIHGRYPQREVLNLSRFISILKFRPLTWRNSHPYIIADRYEDITDPGVIQENKKVDRKIVLYGWVRGTNFKHRQDVHFLGVGDFTISSIEKINDPCPLSNRERRRLDSRDKVLYAPMSNVGNLMFDKDAMYINLKHHQLNYTKASQLHRENENEENSLILPTEGEGEKIVHELQDLSFGLDEKMAQSEIRIFAGSAAIKDVKKQSVETDLGLNSGGDVYGRMVQEEIVNQDGEKRLRVRFADEEEKKQMEESASESDESDSESYNEIIVPKDQVNPEKFLESGSESGSGSGSESENESEIEEKEEGEWAMSAAQDWKENIVERAKSRFQKKTLHELVYGKVEESDGEEEDSSDSDFFTPRVETKQEKRAKVLITNKILFRHLQTQDWSLEENVVRLKERFVTGSWKDPDEQNSDENDEDENSNEDEENEVDFTGTVVKDITVEDSGTREGETEEEAAERRLQEKIDKKREFNATYDADAPEGEDFYAQMLRERKEQNQTNLEEFAGDDLTTQSMFRGFIPGTYVRIEIDHIPCEFGENFDLSHPVVLGGLLPTERQLGFLQCRFKKHRWHHALLKHNNPLVISMGWRRYQTLPIYSMEDRNNSRYRMIKYTPEHQHCVAHFYGPLAPPGTGLIGFVRSGKTQASFRISATGTVLGTNAQFEVQKKLKISGYPYDIHKKTAFVRSMFTSDVEASRFIGAKVRTVAKLRGMIKKVVNSSGDVRVTFEDQVRKSDIVFLRSWVKVEAERYYNPVCSLLLQDKTGWKGMKTVGQLRYERGEEVPKKADAEYKKIERPKQRFAPFKIGKTTLKNLPFSSKPKDLKKKTAKKRKREELGKVVLTGAEKRRHHLLQELATIGRDRQQKKRKLAAKRKEKKLHLQKAEMESLQAYNKGKRKKRYVKQGQNESSKKARIMKEAKAR